MSDLTTVPTATDRKNACDAAVAEQGEQTYIDAEELKRIKTVRTTRTVFYAIITK